MSEPKNVKFNLKAMINKEKTKVLFVEAGGDFVDILLSFLTMPLGKVVKVLDKHFGVESPSIGSLTTLYNGFMNLHSDNFWTEGCKQMLLDPTSSFEEECRLLKLDIADTQLPLCFMCATCGLRKNSVVSMYYDAASCRDCKTPMMKRKRESVDDGEAFVEHTASFIISDDLHVFAEVKQLVQTITVLGITDMDAAETMNVTFGLNEIMGLFKASICSPTPLSDVILNQKRQMRPPPVVKSEDGYQMEVDATSSSKSMILIVTIQKSTNKILFGRAGEDFVDFLTSVLTIPLGGTASLLGSGNYFKSINNLYKSVADVIDSKFLKTADMKHRFTTMKLAHGSISQNHILRLTEQAVNCYKNRKPVSRSDCFRSESFPKGEGKYVRGPRTYTVADDLTVALFSMSSTISMLNGLNIPISDIKEAELQIGPQEAMSILRASLSSTSVLSDALNINPTSEKRSSASALSDALNINPTSVKRPKQEHA